MCQEGHGVYDCCAKCGKYIKYDGVADATDTYHLKCLSPLGQSILRNVGEEAVYCVAAPGIGTVTYRIVFVDQEDARWGILIKDTSRILDPSEVI